jgi:hypothetical protein
MPEWIPQWLHQNAPWLDPLAALITIVTGILAGIVYFFFKPLRWAILKLWSSLSGSFKTGARRVTLRFVAMDFSQSHWVMGSIGDKPILVIVTRWHVTHEPGSGSRMPVRLLKAHLMKPLAKYLIHSQVIITSGKYQRTLWDDTIPEGETRNLTINCNLSKVLKTEKRLEVHLAVEDQLQNNHILPPIMVLPVPRHRGHRNFFRLLFIYSLSHALFVGLENGFILGTITVLVSIPKQLD